MGSDFVPFDNTQFNVQFTNRNRDANFGKRELNRQKNLSFKVTRTESEPIPKLMAQYSTKRDTF